MRGAPSRVRPGPPGPQRRFGWKMLPCPLQRTTKFTVADASLPSKNILRFRG